MQDYCSHLLKHLIEIHVNLGKIHDQITDRANNIQEAFCKSTSEICSIKVDYASKITKNDFNFLLLHSYQDLKKECLLFEDTCKIETASQAFKANSKEEEIAMENAKKSYDEKIISSGLSWKLGPQLKDSYYRNQTIDNMKEGEQAELLKWVLYEAFPEGRFDAFNNIFLKLADDILVVEQKYIDAENHFSEFYTKKYIKPLISNYATELEEYKKSLKTIKEKSLKIEKCNIHMYVSAQTSLKQSTLVANQVQYPNIEPFESDSGEVLVYKAGLGCLAVVALGYLMPKLQPLYSKTKHLCSEIKNSFLQADESDQVSLQFGQLIQEGNNEALEQSHHPSDYDLIGVNDASYVN